MRETHRRVLNLEKYILGKSKAELREEERELKKLYHSANILMRELHPSHEWNSLDEGNKWRIFSTPNDSLPESECTLALSIYDIFLHWIRTEKAKPIRDSELISRVLEPFEE